MPEIQGAYDIHDDNVVSVIDDLPLWSAPFGLKLLETVRMGDGLHLLDIGSGTGFPVVELSQRLGPGCQSVAIDPWPEAVERMRSKVRTWGITNLRIVEGKAESLPFEDQSFDRITSNNGINNTDDEEQVFREIYRVAKPGAQLVLTANLPDTMIEFYRAFRQVLQERRMGEAMASVERHIYAKRKPLSEMRERVESAGFEVVEVQEASFCFRFTDARAMFHHHVMKLAFIEGWRGALPTDAADAVLTEVARVLDEQNRGAGELRLTIPFVCIDATKAG